jgi:hypothetical protein
VTRPDDFADTDQHGRCQQDSGNHGDCHCVNAKVTVATGVTAKSGKEQRAQQAIASPPARVENGFAAAPWAVHGGAHTTPSVPGQD